MTMAAINTRQSNFELLRLVAILMVLFHHATYVALGEVDQSTRSRHCHGLLFTAFSPTNSVWYASMPSS